MEDAIRARLGDLRGTRVICRTGSVIDLRDLAIARPGSADAIIVLSPDEPEPDASVIKTILALVRAPGRRKEPCSIVAEIQDAANLEVARLVGGDEARLIDKAERSRASSSRPPASPAQRRSTPSCSTSRARNLLPRRRGARRRALLRGRARLCGPASVLPPDA